MNSNGNGETDAQERNGRQRPFHDPRIGRFKNRLETVVGGRSAREFARLTGISDTAVRAYLRGETYPTLDKLDHLAQLAGVDAAWLAVGDTASPAGLSKDAKESPGPYRLAAPGESDMARSAFERGIDLAFDLSEDDPSPNPSAIWGPLLIELALIHGLNPSGVDRLHEILRRLEDRNRRA